MSRRAWFAGFVLYGAVVTTIGAQRLNAAESGTVLITELGCTNCHAPAATMKFLPQRPAPLLGELGSRVRPEYVRAFLQQPHPLQPGTPMPDLLHALPEAERDSTLDALAHFLLSLGEPANLKVEKPGPAAVEQGKQLYHAVGCVACHQPFEPAPKHKIDPSATMDEDAPPPDTTLHGSVALPPLARKTNVSALARFLFDPVSVRPAGRMPGMGLELQEAQAIASYLVAREAVPQPPEAALFTVDAKLAERGREAFATLGCAACHSTSVPSLPEKLDFRLVDAKVEGIDDNENRWPSSETPAHAIDGNPRTKYLNHGKQHSGLKFTPPRALLVSGIALTSANDSPDRDPGSLLLEGSADGLKFVQIAARDVPAFKDRYERQQLKLPSADAAYRIYRLTFPTMWSAAPDAMQVAEVELFTATPPTTPVANKLNAKPLKELRARAADGCLGEKPAAGRPKFALTGEQRTALAGAVTELQQTTTPWTAARQVEHAMGASQQPRRINQRRRT
jgi:cytochrome c551/c552